MDFIKLLQTLASCCRAFKLLQEVLDAQQIWNTCLNDPEVLVAVFSGAAITNLPKNDRFYQVFGDAAIFDMLLQSILVAAEDSADMK